MHLDRERGSYTQGMAELQRLQFEERDGQWFITEFYSDGRSQPGEPFMASGHERYSKLQQVLSRIKDKYPGYRPTPIPYDKVMPRASCWTSCRSRPSRPSALHVAAPVWGS
ncbi:hypothetical protein GCM10025870_12380 [Agromyces marinus]|uniref:Uncharacterized protein n=1 Tax=Agromyces marinus TaxID=1389020 RepID=A0ABM8H081_9MICO|nr:hypothetical protein GCM10025870_12380 [Agromyces marinus]